LAKEGFDIGEIIAVFLSCIVGLALTPTVVSQVTAISGAMSAGAARSLIELFPLFWVIFLTAIPVGSIVTEVKGAVSRGGIGIGDLIKVFLPSMVGLALTTTVNSSVATAIVNMSAGATKTMLELFPMFWIIYLIGIPVTAIAYYFYAKNSAY